MMTLFLKKISSSAFVFFILHLGLAGLAKAENDPSWRTDPKVKMATLEEYNKLPSTKLSLETLQKKLEINLKKLSQLNSLLKETTDHDTILYLQEEATYVLATTVGECSQYSPELKIVVKNMITMPTLPEYIAKSTLTAWVSDLILKNLVKINDVPNSLIMSSLLLGSSIRFSSSIGVSAELARRQSKTQEFRKFWYQLMELNIDTVGLGLEVSEEQGLGLVLPDQLEKLGFNKLANYTRMFNEPLECEKKLIK